MANQAPQNLQDKFDNWMRGKGDDPARQTHDNEPEDVVQIFPVKGDPKLTLQYLIDHVRWWRKANDQHYREIFRQGRNKHWADILYPIYRDHFTLSAYRYELMARFQSTPGYPLGCPWIRCTNEQRKMLGCLWPNPWPARYWLPTDAGQEEWITLQDKYNLGLNDAALIEQFKEELARNRTSKKIERPGPGMGVARNEPTWRAIELMDLRYFHGDNLNDSERSIVSKQRNACASFCSKAGLVL